VNVLVGGWDELSGQAKLYWMDYLGTLQQVTKAAHGYAGYFVNSVMDNYWKQDMTLEEGEAACRACVKELKTRFIINQPHYTMKIVTKDGILVKTIETKDC